MVLTDGKLNKCSVHKLVRHRTIFKVFFFLCLRYHLRYVLKEVVFFWKVHNYCYINMKSEPPSAYLFQSKKHILNHLPKDF